MRYEVKERLFRVWREMRFPLGRRRISLFVRFLRLWFSKSKLIREYSDLYQSFFEISGKRIVETRKMLDHLWYVQEAIGAPEKYRLASNRFVSLLNASKYSAAREELALVKRLAKTDSHSKYLVFLFEAMLLVEEGDLEKGLELANQAVTLNPKCMPANAVLTSLLTGQKSYKKAIKYANVIAENKEWRPMGLYLKAIILANTDRGAEALSFINKAVKLDSKNSIFWGEKGAILESLKKHEEAFSSYKKAFRLDKDNKIALMGIIRVTITKRRGEAEKWIDKYLSIEPNNVFALLCKSFVLLKRRALAESGIIAEKALQQTSDKIEKQGLSSILFAGYTLQSFELLKEGNAAKAGELFSGILHLKDDLGEEEFAKTLFEYYRDLLKQGYLDFILYTYSLASQKLSSDDKQMLSPIIRAVEYVKTGDVDSLEKLQKEKRQIVASIIKQYFPETPLPKELSET